MAIMCRASGCSTFVVNRRHAVYCDKHAKALRRHGHPLANAFTRTELAPYRKLAAAKRRATKDAEFWREVDARWNALVGVAKARDGKITLDGNHYHRPTREAHRELVKIACEADAAKAFEVIAGMWLAMLRDPRRFVSDDHWTFELVRRLRSLGSPCDAMRWDHRQNRTRRLYHEMNPKAVKAMAKAVCEALGGAAVHVAKVVMEDERRARERRERYQASFKSIENKDAA